MTIDQLGRTLNSLLAKYGPEDAAVLACSVALARRFALASYLAERNER